MQSVSNRPWRVLVPVLDPTDLGPVTEMAAALARGAQSEITVLNIIEVPSGLDLSVGALPARRARVRLNESAKALPRPVRPVVRIDRTFADGVLAVAADIDADLVLVGWTNRPEADRGMPEMMEGIARASADGSTSHLAVLRLNATSRPERIVVAVRGGPHAELALASAAAISEATGRPIFVLHLMAPGLTQAARDASEHALLAMVRNVIPGDVVRVVRETTDIRSAILAETREADLLLLGASVALETEAPGGTSLGEIPSQILAAARGGVMVVRTRERVETHAFDRLAAQAGTLAAADRAAEELRAIPERVDRWFGESNFHHAEYSDLGHLVAAKQRQGLTVSVVLPTLNEEATIGDIVEQARAHLMERAPLIDELLVIDSASTDRTREIAAAAGARVVQHPDVLAGYGSFVGKGEALWKSLYETTGDIVVWADTDVRDWHPRMIYGTLGPLLIEPRIQYVKGYYQRPIVENGVLKEGGGGRVTELVARPLINLFFPELSGFIQPLSGEYAGRRTLLESIPFFTGYAVEIGHLIDIYERVGLDGLGQVDLERRVHRNQEIEGLSKMSFVILQAVMKRLETGRRASLFAELGSRMKLPRSGREELRLEVIEVADHERPPMISIPEYLERPRTLHEGRPAIAV